MSTPLAETGVQLALDELGTPLHEVTFVVVDLETTGGSAQADAITEIGAVKVRGGEVVGEFGTLVDPGREIPPMITVLTGITNAMVLAAPPIEQVLPSFLEFAAGAVLVAHNARFDVGFLKAATGRLDIAWPDPQVVDTVLLARKVVTRDEAPNHKLGTLARVFGAATTPDHRALHDARATVDVLHGLLGRMTSLGVTHLEDLRTAADPVPPARRRRSGLADHLGTGPGVYQFLGPRREVLYVGTAVNLRRRVRQYFTAAETRKRIGEMVDLATQVRAIPCATRLEAQVREVRLIAEHAPPYNRRSKRPHRQLWLRLTAEALPRVSLVRTVPMALAGTAVGPFPSRASAELAAAAMGVLGLRTCTDRLPARPRAGREACTLGQIGRCGAPCADADAAAGYADLVETAREVLGGDAGALVRPHLDRMAALAAAGRYEEAATHRDRLRAFLRALAAAQRVRPVRAAAEIVAARPDGAGGWELQVVRYGRLVASAVCPRGADPMALVEALRVGAEHVDPPASIAAAAVAEETSLITAWLEQPGVRLVDHEGLDWSSPIGGGADWSARLESWRLPGQDRPLAVVLDEVEALGAPPGGPSPEQRPEPEHGMMGRAGAAAAVGTVARQEA